MDKAKDKAREMVAHGDSGIETRDVVTALQEYSKALDVARTLPFRDQKTSVSNIGEAAGRNQITEGLSLLIGVPMSTVGTILDRHHCTLRRDFNWF